MKAIQKMLKEESVYDPYNPSFKALETVNAKIEQIARKTRRTKVDVGKGPPTPFNDVVWRIQESRLAMNQAKAMPPVIASNILVL